METSGCKCDCFECRVARHDICRYLKKCIRRPGRVLGPVGNRQEAGDL